MNKHQRYLKIKQIPEEKEQDEIRWEQVCKKGSPPPADAVALLREFEGCVVKADGVVCLLKKAAPPPRWICIAFDDGGMQWFSLGEYFNIYLPVADRHTNNTP